MAGLSAVSDLGALQDWDHGAKQCPVVIWEIETPHGYSYFVNREEAREAEIAWALTGVLVFAEPVKVPVPRVINIDERGAVEVRWY